MVKDQGVGSETIGDQLGDDLDTTRDATTLRFEVFSTFDEARTAAITIGTGVGEITHLARQPHTVYYVINSARTAPDDEMMQEFIDSLEQDPVEQPPKIRTSIDSRQLLAKFGRQKFRLT